MRFVFSSVQFNPFEKKFCFIVLQLSNHQFEELAMDVYDEVDRRETDAGELLTIVKNILYIYLC